MRFIRTSAVLIMSCGAVAAFGQSTPAATTPSGATTAKAPVDLSGFKEHIEEKNKALNEQVSSTKAIVKKNTVILEDAKRISEDNKRLEAERKALDAQNAEFARESQELQREAGMSASTPPAAPVRVEPVAPVRVEPPPPPPPARIDTAVAPVPQRVAPPAPAPVTAPPPARVETAVAPRVEPVAPTRPAPVAAPQAASEVQPAVVRAPAPAPEPVVTIAANAPIARPEVTEVPTANVSAASVSEPVRISAGVSQGMLLAPIVPVYPSIAVTAHVQGEVVMEAIISKEGNIASVRAVSGPAMLRTAAIDAVKVARYRPYSVNGQLTEVAATIKVVFQLSR